MDGPDGGVQLRPPEGGGAAALRDRRRLRGRQPQGAEGGRGRKKKPTTL